MKATKTARRRYTPGPWRVSEGNSTTVIAPDGYEVCGTGQGLYVSEQWEKNNAAGRWEHFATREENTTERSDEEQDANARLIAAAPLLYETLLDILDTANRNWNTMDPIECPPGVRRMIHVAALLLHQIENDLH